jgi:hypothetical protein
MSEPTPGIYEHYKGEGKRYEVIGVARNRDTKTLDELVFYRQLYEAEFPAGTLWARPKVEFLKIVEYQGKTVPRYRKVS